MAESSRKRKTQVGACRRGPAVNEPEEIIGPSQPQRLFSFVAQYERYTSKFSARDILEPRYPDDFIAEQNFECYDILHNLRLLPFLTNRQRYYPELVRVFYSNLQTTKEGAILSEVKHVKIRMDIDMFYHITQLGTQGSVLRETWFRNGEMFIQVTMQK